MARVLRHDKRRKNGDRFNLVGWLYDAGYSQVQVVQFLSRNDKECDDEYRATVLTLYQACVKRPAEKRHAHGRVSTGCSSVIDSQHGQGNVLRCVYEEKRNGPQRRATPHPRQEKSDFQLQCGAQCGLEREVRHPLDYVQAKCLSVSSSPQTVVKNSQS